MKWLIVAINLIVLVNSIAAIARQEKIIKKPHGLKPTKPPKTIIDEFRDLSPEDAEFLKQVDKQFKVHGDKIKIKVERENITVAQSRNTKRTIDGSIGYGYHQNQHHQGYYFSQPHLMHQFTLRDVQEDRSGVNEKATEIEIQQSHSFEIKEQDYMPSFQQPSHNQNYHQEQVYEDPVPVIVLRVPGPQKYALHLQALLQQYLEIRAAQYIKALEDQERHGHLMHPQHYVGHQMQYVPVAMYSHQQYYPQQHQQQSYPHYYQQQVHHEKTYQNVPAGDQSYYQQAHTHQPTQEYHSTKHYQQQHQQQQEYPSSYINFVTPSYDQVETHHHHHHHQEPLDTVENYPSDKHTQVIFKKKKNRVARPHTDYTHSRPIVVPDPPAHQYHEEVSEHQLEQIPRNHQAEYEHMNQHDEYAAEAEVVAVTQRAKNPTNYHALQSTLAPSHEEFQERHNPKRMAPFTKEQFEKARRIMMKSKRNRASMRQEKTMEPAEMPST